MELVQSKTARGQAQMVGRNVASKIPVRKYTCSELDVKYLKAKTTDNQKPRSVPVMNKFSQTDISSISTGLVQVPVVVPRLFPEQSTEQTPITGAMGTIEGQNTEVTPVLELETMATTEANEEQQPIMTEWICFLIYFIGKIRSALQDSIPIRILQVVHYFQDIQTAIPEIWPEIKCKSLLAATGILIIAFSIWGYTYGDPKKRLECALKELTKDRTVPSNNWINLF